MNSMFNQLLNVKGTVVEGVRIADSPLRPEPVLEIRVRPRRGMLRCSRCGGLDIRLPTAENLTHENSRSLKNNILVFSEILAHGGVCPCVFHSCNKARYCRTSSCKRQKSQGKRRMMPVLEVPPSVVPQMVVCSLSGVWILVIAGRAEQHTLAQVH